MWYNSIIYAEHQPRQILQTLATAPRDTFPLNFEATAGAGTLQTARLLPPALSQSTEPILDAVYTFYRGDYEALSRTETTNNKMVRHMGLNNIPHKSQSLAGQEVGSTYPA